MKKKKLKRLLDQAMTNYEHEHANHRRTSNLLMERVVRDPAPVVEMGDTRQLDELEELCAQRGEEINRLRAELVRVKDERDWLREGRS